MQLGRAALLRRWLAVAAIVIAGAATLTASIGGSPRVDERFGPFGPKGARMDEQLWLMPSGDPDTALRATVFRPVELAAGRGDISGRAAQPMRRPLVIINHGTDESTRLAVSMPIYYWLSRWFVERGYVVALPQRRGHGATGGPLAEAVGDCLRPDHMRSGLVAASDIEAVASYMAAQPFIIPDKTIVVGISTGGWASLALASEDVPSVRAVVNFAGGRGGHAFGFANRVCDEAQLIDAARQFGAKAKIPTIWFYSQNDSYFGPQLAQAMSHAWRDAGGSVDFHLLPPYGSEGHGIADDYAGWQIWGPSLEKFLAKDRSLVASH